MSNEIRFIKFAVGNGDFVASYFKRDVPCFQFTGFQPADRAGVKEMKKLLAAIVKSADWAEGVASGLSDKYPAHHNLKPAQALKQGGVIRIPLDVRDPSVFVTITSNYFLVPAVWYNEKSTQVQWGRLESAVREAIRIALE